MTLRTPNKKPETRSQDYAALRAAHDEARNELHRAEHLRAGTQNASAFSPHIQQLKIKVAEAALALDQDAKSLNRASGDVESLRVYLLGELSTARAALVAIGDEPPVPAPLAAATPEACAAHVDAAQAYALAHAARRAAITPVHDRIRLVWRTVQAAQPIVAAARAAAHLPHPARVVPDLGDFGRVLPGTIGQLDQAIADIEAQRAPKHGECSAAESRLAQLRAELQDWETSQAKAAEAERIANLSPRERELARYAEAAQ